MSEGDWIPYDSERADGLAMLEWVRRLPWYNGEIFVEVLWVVDDGAGLLVLDAEETRCIRVPCGLERLDARLGAGVGGGPGG